MRVEQLYRDGGSADGTMGMGDGSSADQAAPD